MPTQPDAKPARPKLCPICRKPEAAATAPFCSAHCAQVDLGRWFSEGYIVPGQDGEALADEDSLDARSAGRGTEARE